MGVDYRVCVWYFLNRVLVERTVMKLFRKHHTPDEVGAMLYELLRAGMASPSSELSLERLIHSLDKVEADLHEQYVGEIMVGVMFGATMAIERSTQKFMGEQIRKGMVREFLSHLGEQGASAQQLREWETVVEDHFGVYRTCLENYEELEPPWKLGREFFWNVTGTEEYLAMSIKIATLYLLTARDAAQQLLNQYGPTIMLDLSQ